jgi:hypothetical protein
MNQPLSFRYEYWQEQVKISKKRWNNKEIKKFYWN